MGRSRGGPGEGLFVPEDFDEREPLLTYGRGPWFRLHPIEYDALHFGRNRRHRFDAPDGDYGVLYAAESDRGASTEAFVRDPETRFVAAEEIRRRVVSEIVCERELALVDLTGQGASWLGLRGDVSTAPHELVQTVSQAIHDRPDEPDGIRYRLRHDLDEVGVAIFERAREAGFAVRSLGSLLDEDNQERLGELLEHHRRDLG